MSAQDLDPNFLLPLWRAVVQWLSHQPPLVHAHGAPLKPGTQTSLDRRAALTAPRAVQGTPPARPLATEGQAPVESLTAVRRARRYRPLIHDAQRLQPAGRHRSRP